LKLDLSTSETLNAFHGLFFIKYFKKPLFVQGDDNENEDSGNDLDWVRRLPQIVQWKLRILAGY
jgi:hypothetical protein